MADLTLGWLSLINATTAEVIDAAAAAQFRSVSIRITGRKLADDYQHIVGNPVAMKDLKSRLDGHGLRLSNTSTYHLSRDITLDMLQPVIDATVELGSNMMVATCLDADHARWADFAAGYCEMAAKSGVKIALEFVPFSEARTIAAGVSLVEKVGAPNFGLLLDPLHLARSGGTPADIAPVDPKIIFFAQLCDAAAEHPGLENLPQEARTGRFFPGDGKLPVDAFVEALPAGLEIECEMPIFANKSLSPTEQAIRVGAATRSYLDGFFGSRGQTNPYR